MSFSQISKEWLGYIAISLKIHITSHATSPKISSFSKWKKKNPLNSFNKKWAFHYFYEGFQYEMDYDLLIKTFETVKAQTICVLSTINSPLTINDNSATFCILFNILSMHLSNPTGSHSINVCQNQWYSWKNIVQLHIWLRDYEFFTNFWASD